MFLAAILFLTIAAASGASIAGDDTPVPNTDEYRRCERYLGAAVGVDVRKNTPVVAEAVLEIVRVSDPHRSVGRAVISDRGTAFISLDSSAGKDSFAYFRTPYPGKPSTMPIIRSPLMPSWLELRPCSGARPHVP